LRGYAFVFEDIREKTGLEAEDLIREYKETYCPESQGIEVASRTVLSMILWKV
jgi:methyltransferase domain protein